ncbi:Re/Si-specific NAD(P)(+) transhydrogenase subunit alpha [Haematospirillum jordaniae]|uniref:Re/Si-specific NAD(P)(+) transhydrogenase subunit alpha n=1 Tax=Haematospirillum jordaniae TaxID=1549855 RepID=UPI001432C392|nr:Re/Si-specific NAD(P)(+) transhydrogenase subunit alpha [Haematospirillum jordaniae]NKD84713.1 Re/Si-specific NAD(P)(+) transhydrogenase subunit alpha [Haematospirillum jordaniae]
MKIAIPKERRDGELRVAATPETVKKLIGLGYRVSVETGAGLHSSVADAQYAEAGAEIGADAASTLSDADIVLKVSRPMMAGDGFDEIALLPRGSRLFCHLNALSEPALVKALAERGVDAFAMELMPRITRAQSMDILSSQNNLAGYRAVIDAAAEYGRAFPMMMTAAGTVAPARVLVFGAGVAGLQAVATAKRLGAIVHATDVRPATREQVESLGGKFVVVDEAMEKEAETAGGYAKEMPPEYFERQKKVVGDFLRKADIAITTALVPGRKAPVLISADQVRDMKPGSVIVDLAAEQGGNCALTVPGQTVLHNGVKIVGNRDVSSRLAGDSSALFSRNLFNFIQFLTDREAKKLEINPDEALVKGTCVTRNGAVVHPQLTAV